MALCDGSMQPEPWPTPSGYHAAMKEGPHIAGIAALIGDRARSEILTALLGGQALTATELASVADVTKTTASAHLGRLVDAKLLAVESHAAQGARVLRPPCGRSRRDDVRRVSQAPLDRARRNRAHPVESGRRLLPSNRHRSFRGPHGTPDVPRVPRLERAPPSHGGTRRRAIARTFPRSRMGEPPARNAHRGFHGARRTGVPAALRVMYRR